MSQKKIKRKLDIVSFSCHHQKLHEEREKKTKSNNRFVSV